MKKYIPIFLLLILLFNHLACSVRTMLAPPFPVYEIPLSGKSILGSGIVEDGIFLGSYNMDQYKNVKEKDIDVFEYNFKIHTRTLAYQINNSRMNFNQLLDYKAPFCIKTKNKSYLYYYQKWSGTTYSIIKTEDDHEKIIFTRSDLTMDHVVVFVFIDSQHQNEILHFFSSGDHFESKEFEILQYDISSQTITKVAKGNGRLYSIPYFETKSYIYTEVRDIGQPRKIFCFRKPDYTLVKISPIEKQYLVGSDYDSDLLVAYNHKSFELTLWKGTSIQDTIKCSPFPYELDRATIKQYKDKIYLLVIIEESFDTDKRTLRWMEFDPITKQIEERNWNQDLEYRLDRGKYESTKNDYYILGYERKTREVVFGVVNLIKGTMNYRETNHKIPVDLEFESSLYIKDKFCFWSEGTSFNDMDLTGEKQNYNPTAYYCSLEEPLLQKLKK
jgi:hypothetical protein